jgi:hypothetical protein
MPDFLTGGKRVHACASSEESESEMLGRFDAITAARWRGRLADDL